MHDVGAVRSDDWVDGKVFFYLLLVHAAFQACDVHVPGRRFNVAYVVLI